MILMYHKIFPTSPSIWWVSIDNFYRQLLELRSYKVVYLSDYNPKDPNHVVITFDDGYQNILQFAAPLLKKFSYPFEVFLNGVTLGKNNDFDSKIEPKAKILRAQEAKMLISYGGRLEWHGRHHQSLRMQMNKNIIEKELTISKKFLRLDKNGFKWFSYPHGDFNEAVKQAAKNKFKGALTCNQGNESDNYCLNRCTVLNETSFKKNLITVVIPCYNYGLYLVEALESVLHQTRSVEEIIIADDCSTDNTEEVARYYQEKFPTQIKYIKNKHRLGIIKNYNQALTIAKGNYLCILDADNFFVSNFIEKTAEILDMDKKIGIVYTDFALFGSRAKIKYEMFPVEWREAIKGGQYYLIKFPDYNKRSKELLKERNFIHGNSLFRREVFLEIGGYKKHKKFPEDQYLFQRIIKNGWFARKVHDVLLGYRQHSRNQQNDTFNSFAELGFYKIKCQELERELNKIKSSKYWFLLYVFKNPRKGIPLLLNQIIFKN